MLRRRALVGGLCGLALVVAMAGNALALPISGLVSYWDFNSSLTDTASSYSYYSGASTDNLAAVGGAARYVTGVSGKAIALGVKAGDATYLNAPLSTDVNLPATYTIEGWVRPTAIGPLGRRFVLSWGDPNQHTYHFWINGTGATGKVSEVHNQSNLTEVWCEGGSVQTNLWQHIAATADGTNLRVFLNGANVTPGGAVPYNGTIRAATEGLGIGDNNTGQGAAYRFTGYVDNLSMWKVALTPAEIQERYTASLPNGKDAYKAVVLAANPECYYRLGESTLSAANDSSPNAHNGSYVNSPTLGVFGIPGEGANTAAYFSGTNQYAGFGDIDALDGLTALTVEAWARWEGASNMGGSPSIMRKQDMSGGVFALGAGWDGDHNNARFYVNQGGGWYHSGDSTTDVTDGNWHYIVGEYDGSQIKIYVDGLLQSSAPLTGALSANASPVVIACMGNGTQEFWQGSLDELAVYRRALSLTEIQDHYTAGLTFVTQEVVPEPASLSLLAAGVAGLLLRRRSKAPRAARLPRGRSKEGKATLRGTTLIGGLCGLALVVAMAGNALALPVTGLVSYWDFDNSLADTAASFTNYSGASTDNLTALGGTARYVAGVSGRAIALGAQGGDATWLTAPVSADVNLAGTPATYTIEGWIYPTVAPGQWRRLVLSWVGGAQSYHFALFNSQVSQINEQTNGVWARAEGGTVQVTHWQHIAATADGSQVRVYLNGQNVTPGGGIPYDGTIRAAGSGLGVGDNFPGDGGTFKFQGYMDQLAMWKVPLSAADILARYNAVAQPKPLTGYGLRVLADNPEAYWRLGEIVGNAALDTSPHAHNGSYANGSILGVAGIPGTGTDTAVQFNGTNQYAGFGDIDALDNLTAVTAEAWVRWQGGSSTGTPVTIVRKQNPSGTFALGAGWDANHNNAGFYVFDGTAWRYSGDGTTDITDGQWHYVVGVYDGTRIRAYVDGVEEASAQLLNATLPGGASVVGIASYGIGGGEYWNGVIDEVAVYTRALTLAEIGEHYAFGRELLDIPEPTSAVLLLLSLGALARRRSKRCQPRTGLTAGSH